MDTTRPRRTMAFEHLGGFIVHGHMGKQLVHMKLITNILTVH